MNKDLLIKIDKRLAILEAITNEHSKFAEKEFIEVKRDIKQLSDQMVLLRVRVAGIAASVAFIVAGVVQWLSHFSS